MVTRDNPRHVAVIGAGLAGAACARALARAGLRVTVLEQAGEPASGASGNPIGILHRLVSKDYNLASQWIDLGLATTLRWVDALTPIAQSSGIGVIGTSCGVAQLTADASDLVLWDPKGAWIKPQRFVQACLADAQQFGASVRLNSGVRGVSGDGTLIFQDGSSEQFDAVVICTAQTMDLLLPKHGLSLNAIRGTVSRYVVPDQHALPCVVCASGYATPVIEGEMVVGASYERLPLVPAKLSDTVSDTVSDTAPRALDTDSLGETDDMSNLDRLRIIDRRLADICAHLPAQDRTSIRSATLDRMPHVGRVLDTRVSLAPSVSQLHQMPRNDRIWVLGGLGSRGLSSAALGAELIAAQMMGTALPVPERLAHAVDPARFALRRHQRRK
jgi:tRNA 5-methylaminomethyl-2-thiouridine biosynthesis bifunctional protein